MRILYVEDDNNDADLLQRELHQKPEMIVDIAPTLYEARNKLTDDLEYDIALIDLFLPDGSGLELLKEIRRRALPLAAIILTGQGDEEAAVAALKVGADDYLVKRGNYLERLPLTLEIAYERFMAEAARKTSSLKVIYVEKNVTDMDLTRRHLSRYAPYIELETFYTAAEALESLQKREALCDVLLLDYSLPGMNALEMLKALQHDLKIDLPVVLVTGHGDEEVATQALRLGAVEYITKHPGYLFQLPAAIRISKPSLGSL